jgi:hypothetical protein
VLNRFGRSAVYVAAANRDGSRSGGTVKMRQHTTLWNGFRSLLSASFPLLPSVAVCIVTPKDSVAAGRAGDASLKSSFHSLTAAHWGRRSHHSLYSVTGHSWLSGHGRSAAVPSRSRRPPAHTAFFVLAPHPLGNGYLRRRQTSRAPTPNPSRAKVDGSGATEGSKRRHSGLFIPLANVVRVPSEASA